MSVNIKIRNAQKKYGNNIIIDNLSLDIKEGEFFTLLGPSGCGKTTLLRMIAGFNSIENGDFFFKDKRINDLDPSKRNIGMVFQNYAIFPHLSVEKNVQFGLKNRKVSKEEMDVETDKFLKIMQIFDYKNRMPENLSGGQQQRVALARALVIKPDVLLMDEPLSNLDAKLRVDMRTAIKEIQHTIGITTVYVTHDQEEAMAVSDRIAVMKGGYIQHVGTPKDIYQRPANIFVATFIGRTNVLDGTLEKKDGVHNLILGSSKYVVSLNNVQENAPSGPVKISIRPEEFVITEDKEGLKVTVDDSVFLGLNTHYFVHTEDGTKLEIIQISEINSNIEKGAEIYLKIKNDKINVFTADGEKNILLGVNNDMVSESDEK